MVKLLSVLTKLVVALNGMPECCTFVLLLVAAGLLVQHQNSTSVNFISSAYRLSAGIYSKSIPFFFDVIMSQSKI